MSNSTVKPASSPRLRTIAKPTEHGAWDMVFAPIILGLWLAPSVAGVCLGLASLGAFLTRHPLNLALSDWRRGKRYPRTIWAERFALGYGAVALLGLVAATVTTTYPFWPAVLLAAPLALVQIRADLLKQNRSALAEVSGATAMSALIAAIALAAGWTFVTALLLWALVSMKAVSAIIYVRTRTRLARNAPAHRAGALLLHVGSLVAVSALVWSGLVGWAALAGFALLLLRCVVGLLPPSLPTPTWQVGVQEVVFSLLTISSIALAGVTGRP